MFNVSPFASLAEVNRMLSAWSIEASGYELARGGVENTCLIVDTPAHPPKRVVLRIHRPAHGRARAPRAGGAGTSGPFRAAGAAAAADHRR